LKCGIYAVRDGVVNRAIGKSISVSYNHKSNLRIGLMSPTIFPDTPALAGFCRRNGIRRLSLFGSRLKGTETADSDIDLLVEFEDGRVPGLMALAGMEIELSEMLGGKKVDLRTPNDLSRYFRDEVVRGALLQYAA
jgi:uncharacterized protein